MKRLSFQDWLTSESVKLVYGDSALGMRLRGENALKADFNIRAIAKTVSGYYLFAYVIEP